MRNFIQPGKTTSIVAAAALASGAGVVVGAIFGVALTAAEIGDEVEILREGVVELPKASGVAVAAGDVAYFNKTNGTVTKTSAAGLYAIGTIEAAQVAGDATCVVRLDGKAVAAAA